MSTFLLMRFFFLSGYFNSILSTMVILSCPVFVSLVFESIGIRPFFDVFSKLLLHFEPRELILQHAWSGSISF